MKHDEFQVKGHRFGNEVRALLRVNLRGAFFALHIEEAPVARLKIRPWKVISRQSASVKQ